MRVKWRERGQRRGWDVHYTTIGGRFAFDPIAQLPDSVRASATRSLSQAMCAATPSEFEPSEAVSFWASVVRKVVQRGTLPTIHHRDRSAFDVRRPRAKELIAAIVGPTDQRWELDPAVELHETYERPFWDLIEESAPPLQRWLTPRAWFEGLVGATESTNERWVDFLLYRPWSGVPAVIEIDGSGHAPADRSSTGASRSKSLSECSPT